MITGDWTADPSPAIAVLAEQALLGACMIRGRLDAIPPELRPDDFDDARHRALYRVMLALEAEEMPVDTVTVRERLLTARVAELVGLSYAVSLIDGVPNPDAEGIAGYARIVMEASTRRRLGLKVAV